MTVKELRERLKDFPDDALVVTDDKFRGTCRFASHFFEGRRENGVKYVHDQLHENAEDVYFASIDSDCQYCDQENAAYCVLSVE